MAQDVSYEAALPVFRQRCSELHDENLILRARVAEVEKENARLRAEQADTPAQAPSEHVGS